MTLTAEKTFTLDEFLMLPDSVGYRIVYVHRADGSVTKLRESDEITGEAALPGFRRKVAELFAR